jgi:hypothetical protein
MQWFKGIIEALPSIIKQAGSNPFALLALLAILVGFLAYVLLATIKPIGKHAVLVIRARFYAFALAFAGAFAFGWAVLHAPVPKDIQESAGNASSSKGSSPAGQKHEPQGPLSPHNSQTEAGFSETTIPQPTSFATALERAISMEGSHNVPGNPPQACQAYAQALHLVYPSLTSMERGALRTSEAQCAKGRSEEQVATLKTIAQRLEPQMTPNR